MSYKDQTTAVIEAVRNVGGPLDRVTIILDAFRRHPDGFRLGDSIHPDTKKIDVILSRLTASGVLRRVGVGSYELGPEAPRPPAEAPARSHVAPSDPQARPTAAEPSAPPELTREESLLVNQMLAWVRRFEARRTTLYTPADVRDFWGTETPGADLRASVKGVLDRAARNPAYKDRPLWKIGIHMLGLRRGERRGSGVDTADSSC